MKIRKGFVSNSSTSSFCIYGCSVDSYEVLDMLSATEEQRKEAEEEGVYEVLGEILSGTDIEYWAPYDWDTVFFGFRFAHIPDSVVVGDWKKEKEAVLKEHLGSDIQCNVIQEAYLN
jgi:hypothetical protein